jgi:rhodanese-related sulfurtransferase
MNMKNMQRISLLALFAASLVVLPSCWRCGCGAAHDEQQTQQAQEAKKDLVVINVLDKPLYDDCHIAGSINVQLSELEQFAATLDKETTEVVVYCSNYQCASSDVVAAKLADLGCKKVRVYEGGMAEWYQQGLPVEGACKSDYLALKVERAPESAQEPKENVITAQDLYARMQPAKTEVASAQEAVATQEVAGVREQMDRKQAAA